MTGKTRVRNQGIATEDAIHFLRKGALVEETGGKPSLTSKGERFLQALLESSSHSPGNSASPEG